MYEKVLFCPTLYKIIFNFTKQLKLTVCVKNWKKADQKSIKAEVYKILL